MGTRFIDTLDLVHRVKELLGHGADHLVDEEIGVDRVHAALDLDHPLLNLLAYLLDVL